MADYDLDAILAGANRQYDEGYDRAESVLIPDGMTRDEFHRHILGLAAKASGAERRQDVDFRRLFRNFPTNLDELTEE